jgi:hypothetical protein
MIMKTTKNLALVALAALSLGTGTAMAQEGGNGDPGLPYWTLARQADALRQIEARNAARNANRVQAGSSDTDVIPSRHVIPFHFDDTTLANPG